MTQESLDVFKRNYLVVGLPDNVVQEIAALAEEKTYSRGEAVIAKHQRTTDLFVILDGAVHVYNAVGDKLAEATPGAVIGEVSLVDDGPRSADAIANGTVQVAMLPGKELRAYMGSHREVGFMMLANLARVLSMRLRGINTFVEDQSLKPFDHWKYADRK